MSIDTAKKINKDAKSISFAGEMYITGFGEPLLHKNICDIVECIAHDNDYQSVTIVTNGDRLTRDVVINLKSAGVTKIVVSMYDGPHQQSRVSDIIRDEIPVTFRERYYSLGSKNNYGIENINNRSGLTVGGQIKEPLNKPCYIPFNKCQVDWNGDILICDQDWGRRGVVGNINETSIGDVWVSAKMRAYREKLLNSNRCMSPCSTCDVTGDVYGKESFDAFRQFYSRDTQ